MGTASLSNQLSRGAYRPWRWSVSEVKALLLWFSFTRSFSFFFYSDHYPLHTYRHLLRLSLRRAPPIRGFDPAASSLLHDGLRWCPLEAAGGDPMAEGCSSRNGVLVKMDSTDSRWVSRDADEEEEGEAAAGSSHRDSGESGLQSEDDEAGEQRLIRTGQHIDSLDLEALEVPCVQRTSGEQRLIRTRQHIDSFDLEALEVPCVQRNRINNPF